MAKHTNDFWLRHFLFLSYLSILFCHLFLFYIFVRLNVSDAAINSRWRDSRNNTLRHGYGLFRSAYRGTITSTPTKNDECAVRSTLAVLSGPISTRAIVNDSMLVRGIKRTVDKDFCVSMAGISMHKRRITYGLKSIDLFQSCFARKITGRHFLTSPFKSYKFSLARQCCFVDFTRAVVRSVSPPRLPCRHSPTFYLIFYASR